MRCIEERTEIVQCAKVWINIEVVGDVVAVITKRRRIKRKKPNGGDTELLEIIQLLDQTTEIPHSVAIAVTKSFDVQLVDDCVLVPKRIGFFAVRLRHEANSWRTNGARQVIDVPIACEQNASPARYLESVGRIPSHRLRHPNGRPASDPFLLSNFCLCRLNLIFCMHRKAKKQAHRKGKWETRRFSAPPQLQPGAPTDLELMQAIQAEDPDAISQLYARYNGILKALILRVIHNEAEADDLLQEIFMEIWNQAKNFSAQKGKPLGWMVTLARRRAIDGLRKKQAYARAEERLQNEVEQQPDAWLHNANEEEIVLRDTRVLIRKVINGLPLAQQQAINFAFFRGMSQREIAAKTNTPLGTVKTRLELGLKKIYDGLKELRDEL